MSRTGRRPTRRHAAAAVVAVSPQRVSRIAVGVCLDCAAALQVDEATGALVDRWGQATCGASYRAHAPDLPALDAGPAAPATSMTGPPAAGCAAGRGRGGTRPATPASRGLRKILPGRLRVNAAPGSTAGPALTRETLRARYLAPRGQAHRTPRQPASHPAPQTPRGVRDDRRGRP